MTSHRMRSVPPWHSHFRRSDGLSLIEVAIAVAILGVVLCGAALLTRTARQSEDVARRLTLSAVLAGQKLAQLQALAFRYDDTGTPMTDEQSDVSVSPEQPAGGTGLRPSPSDALRRNVSGYCDFVWPDGRTTGGGVAPAGAAFVRRWGVATLPPFAADALALQVRVLDLSSVSPDDPGDTSVTLTTVRGRLRP